MRHSLKRRAFLASLATTSGALAFHGPSAPRADASVIQVLLTGGPAAQETFDPKPEASLDRRSPLTSIPTPVPGIHLSECLPRLAQRADQFALVRSLFHEDLPIHETGLQRIQTGASGSDEARPHFGAVAAERTWRSAGPSWVILGGPLGDTGVDLPQGQTAGTLSTSAEPVYLTGPHRDPITGFLDSCRTAVNLVQAGTRVVTINMFTGIMDQWSWDMHASSGRLFVSPEDYRETLGPALDLGLSSLMDDLTRRGLSDRVLVMAAGEMGRTPLWNRHGGRDHWCRCWSALLFGGGIRGGHVLGASDASGGEIVDRPVPAESLAWLADHVLGMRTLPADSSLWEILA